MRSISLPLATLCLLTLSTSGIPAEEGRALEARRGAGGRSASFYPARLAEANDHAGATPAADDFEPRRKAPRPGLEALKAVGAAGPPPARITLDAAGAATAEPDLAPPAAFFRLERDFEGPSYPASFPPDATIAAGPGHLLQAVNRLLRVSDKRGAVLFEAPFSSWWFSVATDFSAFDPKVLFDQHAGRWVLSAAGVSTTTFDSWYLLSVSKTPDPTADWCLFALPAWIDGNTPTNNWPDFPQLGVDARAVYLTSNQIDNDTGLFTYSKLRILEKTTLYDPACGAVLWHDVVGLTTADEDTVQPAHTFGDPGREYLVSAPSLGGGALTLWSVAFPDGGAPVVTEEAELAVHPFAVPPDAAQPRGEAPLGTVDTRLWNAVLRDGMLHAANQVACLSGGVCARFFGVDVSAKSVALDETYGAPGLNYFYPAVAVSGAGDLVAVMSRSGPSEFGGGRFAVRPRGSPSFGPSVAVRSGEGVLARFDGIGRNRWGDYNGAAADPVDRRLVWVLAEHATPSTGEWGTWVGAVVPTAEHALTINAGPSAGANPAFPGVPIDLAATAVDTAGHDLSWAWTASCAGLATGGSLDDPAAAHPVWTPPANPGRSARTCELAVSVNDGLSAQAEGSARVVLLPDPDDVVLSTDFTTTALWTSQPPWSLSGESVHSAPFAFSDGPQGPYGEDVNASLYGPVFEDAADFAYLSWWQMYDVERDGDAATLWIREDYGAFQRARSFSGTRSDWHQVHLDLASYLDAYQLSVAFQLFSNSEGSRDGWHVDDVAVHGLSFTPHAIVFTSGPRGNANPVGAGGEVDLTVTAVDLYEVLQGHTVDYSWSAACLGAGGDGAFSDPAARAPIWTAPADATGSPAECVISVMASDRSGLSASASFVQTVLPFADADGDGVEDALDVCPAAADPDQEDLDEDGPGDLCDVCPGAADPGQADLDADGAGDACDNCREDANPDQSDLDADGSGDACDLTITSPLEGAAASCGVEPLAVTWTPWEFDRFRVDVSWDPTFKANRRINSGKKLLAATTWTMPAGKWSRACRKAGGGSLYLRVYGRLRGTRNAGYSQTVTVDLP